jgi:hypothetical protein
MLYEAPIIRAEKVLNSSIGVMKKNNKMERNI